MRPAFGRLRPSGGGHIRAGFDGIFLANTF